MDDAMDMDSEDLEEETEAEIDKVGRNQAPSVFMQNTVWTFYCKEVPCLLTEHCKHCWELSQNTCLTRSLNAWTQPYSASLTVLRLGKSRHVKDRSPTPWSHHRAEPRAGVQVLLDVAGATMADLAGSAAPKQRAAQAAPAETAEEDEALQARLDAVRS